MALKQSRYAPVSLDRDETLKAAREKLPGQQGLPQLIDLGADKCIPCKMMEPVLEELRREFKGRLEVTFIDVWKNPGAGRHYGIRVIPTQIFYDAGGSELFRHEGFFSKKDILDKWKELGISLQ
ncbi:MAG: thioredoxin family protein [Candidatus Glassbacteria bacterium]|nr:thioredoxin family protein [Candidatus Glassbacteria bacterium]